ncbi:hypothetical protein [Mycolicibacterium monacense]|uniref:Uncharacterized protein n=1 Tax=Mycolicibacterium monacense TaxID=85693 RepID=A0AAD1ISM3_MYCMB|nr:hypothetical protein [Mycolicibacterium monacense]MDA4102046.1 hypothetical protein [Mycolicibacterium monacense DSM 44395]ORB20033.1 hypothetical protein BST34_13810 [Mycolicibacterium monacense DSM 44395]QHP86789.1 hypothetical protein EWR22_16325 [Mycolicibacterium monacense DSM 44395]BBZ60139.1 hypothetical protein MMON_14400 [Mycolicibacterium monacense]
MSTLTVTLTDVDGEPMLDSEAMALLFGVRTEDVRALPTVNGVSTIPREWVKRGRQRTREAMAHTGSDFIIDGLRYWARRDHNAELEVIYR